MTKSIFLLAVTFFISRIVPLPLSSPVTAILYVYLSILQIVFGYFRAGGGGWMEGHKEHYYNKL
jgi:hypothetical protein